MLPHLRPDRREQAPHQPHHPTPGEERLGQGGRMKDVGLFEVFMLTLMVGALFVGLGRV